MQEQGGQKVCGQCGGWWQGGFALVLALFGGGR
ncbi:hypothetical protein STREPTOSP366_69070 [Streptomyces variabilis]